MLGPAIFLVSRKRRFFTYPVYIWEFDGLISEFVFGSCFAPPGPITLTSRSPSRFHYRFLIFPSILDAIYLFSNLRLSFMCLFARNSGFSEFFIWISLDKSCVRSDRGHIFPSDIRMFNSYVRVDDGNGTVRAVMMSIFGILHERRKVGIARDHMFWSRRESQSVDPPGQIR
jgi:hypothetical protein